MSRRVAWWVVAVVALLGAGLVLATLAGAALGGASPSSAPSFPPGSPAASPAPASPDGTPAPFIPTFAAAPGVRPQPALPSPTAARSMPVNLDGCDHGYGTRAQCVPWTFPPGVTDKCAWLLSHGFTRLAVTGTDRHRLDPDGDGVACAG